VFQQGDCLDPSWNPGGIWRPVRVTETGPVRIAKLRVLCREATAERAVVAFRATLDSDDARSVRVRTELGVLDHVLDQPLAAGTNEVEWTVAVERPDLWWPRALGAPVLHDVRVAVELPEASGADGDGDDGAGAAGPSDERRLRIGLRSVRLRRWICSVNGERLFLKGTNLPPTRMALAEAAPADLARDVELAQGAGLDLLRLHAHVARPETYDAADERGLLLWQDMPLQRGYARGVRRQAVRQAREAVDLLGHHPSIAVWCGHDEPLRVDTPPDVWSDPAATRRVRVRTTVGQQLPSWNKTVLDASVKRALDKADGTRPVIAHSGVLPHVPQLDGTDSHLFFGWHHGDERDLAGAARAVPKLVRFVSELGAQSVPSDPGAAFCEPERWPDLDWQRLAEHHGMEKGVFDRRVPPAVHGSFAEWRDATQRYQANLIKRQVEVLRRLKYRPTGGFAQFHLADAHPAVSWSVLGHDRTPKLGYQALREACRPVIVVADRMPASVTPGQALALDVHVVSDKREPIEGARVAAKLTWPGGDHMWRWTGDVPADACVRVGTIQFVVPDVEGPLGLSLVMHHPPSTVVRNDDESPIIAAQ
jgi:beta-mannosidase